MPWTRPTLQTLIGRIEGDIRSRLTSGAALLRRSMLAILARVWAGALWEEYGFQSWLAQQLVESTVTDLGWLYAYGVKWSVPQLPASFAEGTITIIGTPGTDVPSGTTWVSDIGQTYTTNLDATIAVLATWATTSAYVQGARITVNGNVYLCITSGVSATSGSGPNGNTLGSPITDGSITWVYLGNGTALVDVAVTAVTAGSDANLNAGDSDDPEALTIQSPLSGVSDTANIIVSIDGGAAQESSEAWRDRIVARISSPPAGGTATDYLNWATSNAGVLNAYVFPLYYGLCTVKVVILPDDSAYSESTCSSTSPPANPATVLGQVYTKIEALRPLCAWVEYRVAAAVVVDLTIAISPNNSGVQALITDRLAAMFQSDSAPNGTLYLSHLNEAISGNGVLDQSITQIKVAGSPISLANYTFTGFQYMTLGTVTFTSL